MLLSLIILAILIFGFRRGYRRGLVLQILTTIGYLVVWIVARFGAKPLATGIGQFVGNLSLDSSVSAVAASQSSSFFLNGLAFSAILTVGYFIVHRVAYALNKVTWLPVIHQVNSLAGGLINLVIRYVVIFLTLNLLILVPISGFQSSYQSSSVAQWIVKQTPVLSKRVFNWWLTEQKQKTSATGSGERGVL
ncbi:CvpA family protein [Levilactobacillus andaensis]|uniref:CvpA family protein n=1 Tax=Levilactobacillus andaensis TaxID=2799570 RepID=UPI001942A974|nr:CvpA family protein [Levilactobacillus andaensis]